MNNHFWTIYAILVAGGVFATAAVVPYSLAINPGSTELVKAKLAEKGSRLPPMLLVYLGSVVQGGLLIALAIFLGLRAAQVTGLRLPVLEALVSGQPALPVLLSGLAPALLLGFGSGAVLIALEGWLFQPRLPEAFRGVKGKQATWKRLLAGFYGGIYEEELLRLFVMNGLIWLIGLAAGTPAGQIHPAVFWTANILAAVLFGLGHLPATARMAKLTPLIVGRALLLNGLVGLVFGWLFWRYGLEFAMIAHFCGDLMIHVLLPEVLARAAQAQPV